MEDSAIAPQPQEAVTPPVQEPMPSHPEEMKTIFDFRVGRMISLQGSARMTPAGVVTAGITAFAVLFGLSLLAQAGRKRS